MLCQKLCHGIADSANDVVEQNPVHTTLYELLFWLNSSRLAIMLEVAHSAQASFPSSLSTLM